ncbi:hypothetical protein P2H44_22825 [Albimonas sp. CAU 1670]|uniref:hypothetical protein n=1 Tax=Albimonas sp. CAU 1670 TaxID=3032599 RepID=UPI0023DCC48B|nr:hypothetical protein [Albimonas sp. CAU 1670]MDF2235400.1 hypothetical protein [Albimonas sp. CAU 1670]
MTNRLLLERCHSELCNHLGQIIATQDRIEAEHRMMAAAGVLALPTELDQGRSLERLRSLLRDLEHELGSRPRKTDPWVGRMIDRQEVPAAPTD